MPTVKGKGQVSRHGYQSRDDIEKTHSPDKARDDLSEAFAGEENEVREKGDMHQHTSGDMHQHSTNLKSRKTKESREKTPIR